jgi:N-acetylneuraminate synthase
MSQLRIHDTPVGDGHPCFFIAEIGINHNGDLEMAKKLIELADAAGCNAVKFQKRTVDVVYTPAELASCWDEGAVDFIDGFEVCCYKIASASLTDDHLLAHTRAKARHRPVILSTGMSTLEQVDHAVELLGKDNLILLHTCSTYPCTYEEINLRTMLTLKQRYGVPVGYSGHETGLAPSLGAVAMGACVVERHITLDRALWGSDQAASLGPSGLIRLIRDIRLVEAAMGDGVKRVAERELPIIKKLRRVGA